MGRWEGQTEHWLLYAQECRTLCVLLYIVDYRHIELKDALYIHRSSPL